MAWRFSNRRMTNRRTSDGRRERPRHSRVSSFGERLAVHQRSHRPAFGWRRSTSTRAVVSSRHGMTGTGCIFILSPCSSRFSKEIRPDELNRSSRRNWFKPIPEPRNFLGWGPGENQNGCFLLWLVFGGGRWCLRMCGSPAHTAVQLPWSNSASCANASVLCPWCPRIGNLVG